MKITTWTIQTPRTIPKLVTHNIARWKQTLSKKSGFPENPTAHTFLIKVAKKNNFWVQFYFSNPTSWKPTAPAFQNTLTFAVYLFNSRSNMRVNLFHWNSLHSKKAILFTYFFRTNTTFPRWKSQNQNLQPTSSESLVLCGHFEPKGGGSNIYKSGAIFFATRWQ